MRVGLAGLVVLWVSRLAMAQASGEVQAIGFNGVYRPDAWVPMIVRLKPETAEPGNYEIRVYQHDLDGDRPVYVRTIPLNGSGQAATQSFWMYFLPQPTNKGLPSLGSGTSGSLRDLQKELTVYLCAPGGKQLVKLPLTSQLDNVDPPHSMGGGSPRSTKLVLVVSNAARQVQFGDYRRVTGVTSDVEIVNVRPNELPESPLGYDAIDAVIWLDGDPLSLSVNGSQTAAAFKDYVRYGGHLVVCQSVGNWQEDAGFGDMLPVDVTELSTKTNLEPLRSMAAPRRTDPAPRSDMWGSLPGPYQVARATTRPGAVVDNWIDWKQDGSNLDVTPYIARRAYGLGEVTYVAQSLASDTTPTNPDGWPYVWNKILGWVDDAYVPPANVIDGSRVDLRIRQFQPGTPLDVGYKSVDGLNLDSKGAWLVFLAVVFFLVYWAVAGPGGYLVLMSRKRQGLSWFLYGSTALIATLLTVAVVKLVLRGPPEIRHLTLIRSVAGQPTLAYCRFGLYIPRDGEQSIELEKTLPDSLSYIGPMPEHPQSLGDTEDFPSPADYEIPVRDLKSEPPVSINVPYRSSLKKFEARWVGDYRNQITGYLALDPTSTRLPIKGTLFNGTGSDLTCIYIGFNIGPGVDWMIYIPDWKAGTTYDIKRDLADPDFVGDASNKESLPGKNRVISDQLDKGLTAAGLSKGGWAFHLGEHFRKVYHSQMDSYAKVAEPNFDYVLPLLTFADRFPPMVATVDPNSQGRTITNDRVEYLRRGARMFNASPAISAGKLVVTAVVNKGAVPIPLLVDRDTPGGDGVTIYQAVLNVDRGPVSLPETRPSKP